ncbi:MAG: hypothetical protein IKM90_03400 [Bacteroidaceae bacterium]|nr:hypothetical protein [Bacteroidaceae bacterium]
MRKTVLLLALTSMLMSLCIPVFAQQAYVKPKVLAQYVIKIGDISEETMARPKGKEDYTQNVYQLPDGITFKELIFGLPGIEKNVLGRLVTKEGKEIVSSIFFNELPVFSRERYYTNHTKLKAAPFSSSGLIYTDDTKLNSGTAFVQIKERTDGIQGAQIIIEYYQDVSYDMVGGNLEYVDLGLSVKWASRNVGAAGPEQTGGFFSWSEDDIAHAKLGGSWRMPTTKEMKELIKKCAWSWASVKGEIGYLITSNKPGYTDRSIFLPYYYGGTSGDVAYWSGSLDVGPDGGAASLWFDFMGNIKTGYCYRNWELPVRPVCK